MGFRIPWAVFWIPKPRIPHFLTWGDEECSFGVVKESKSWSHFHQKLIWETTFPTFASFPVTRKSILASTDVRSIIVGASCIDVTERDRRSTFVDIWIIKLKVGCRVPCEQVLPLLIGWRLCVSMLTGEDGKLLSSDSSHDVSEKTWFTLASYPGQFALSE